MQIVFYGAGSCRPTPKSPGKPTRSYTGWYTELEEDSLLFDIGGGVLHKMLEDGKDIIKKPTHLLVSHLHIDHTIDTIQLLQGRGVASRDVKIEKILAGGPLGFKDLISKIWNYYEETFKLDDLISFTETKSGIVFEKQSWKVTSSPINHFKDSVCYKLETQGKMIVYSGDMMYDETISEFGKGADIAILECSYPDRNSMAGSHMCPEDVGNLAKKGNFKKVVLTHLLPFCEGREDEMIAISKLFCINLSPLHRNAWKSE